METFFLLLGLTTFFFICIFTVTTIAYHVSDWWIRRKEEKMETLDIDLNDETSKYLNDENNFTKGELPKAPPPEGEFYLWWGMNDKLYITAGECDETTCKMWKTIKFDLKEFVKEEKR